MLEVKEFEPKKYRLEGTTGINRFIVDDAFYKKYEGRFSVFEVNHFNFLGREELTDIEYTILGDNVIDYPCGDLYHSQSEIVSAIIGIGKLNGLDVSTYGINEHIHKRLSHILTSTDMEISFDLYAYGYGNTVYITLKISEAIRLLFNSEEFRKMLFVQYNWEADVWKRIYECGNEIAPGQIILDLWGKAIERKSKFEHYKRLMEAYSYE